MTPDVGLFLAECYFEAHNTNLPAQLTAADSHGCLCWAVSGSMLQRLRPVYQAVKSFTYINNPTSNAPYTLAMSMWLGVQCIPELWDNGLLGGQDSSRTGFNANRGSGLAQKTVSCEG